MTAKFLKVGDRIKLRDGRVIEVVHNVQRFLGLTVTDCNHCVLNDSKECPPNGITCKAPQFTYFKEVTDED